MSDGRGSSVGPRMNPLFGGASSRPNTPNWAKTAPPQHAASTPSAGGASPRDSPARPHFGHHANMPPCGHGDFSADTASEGTEPSASPYHPPPRYYVQTPATSDRGGTHSVLSSAPSSPRFPFSSPYASDTEASPARQVQSTKAKGQAGKMSRLGSALLAHADLEGGDEEEFEDEERDKQRRAKLVTGIVWITLLTLIAALGITGFVLWSIYEPVGPKYTFLGAEVNTFVLQAEQTDPTGVSTSTLSGSVNVSFTAHNPNARFVMEFLESPLALGFSGLSSIMAVNISAHNQEASTSLPVSAAALALHYPLYGAGPQFAAAVSSSQYVEFQLTATLHARVTILWSILRPTFDSTFRCTLGFNSTTHTLLNSTCGSPTSVNPFAFH